MHLPFNHRPLLHRRRRRRRTRIQIDLILIPTPERRLLHHRPTIHQHPAVRGLHLHHLVPLNRPRPHQLVPRFVVHINRPRIRRPIRRIPRRTRHRLRPCRNLARLLRRTRPKTQRHHNQPRSQQTAHSALLVRFPVLGHATQPPMRFKQPPFQTASTQAHRTNPISFRKNTPAKNQRITSYII